MERILTELESTVTTTQYWFQEPGGKFRSTGDDPDQILSAEELATLHPHLPIAMQGLFSYKAETCDNALEGFLVCDTLELLQYGGVEIANTAGRLELFINIDTLEIPKRRDGLIEVGGIQASRNHIKHGDIEVPFVTWTEWRQIETHRSYLDETYPGWEERYRVMEGLGCASAAMWRHIMTKVEVVNPEQDIAGITFS